ncbi:MAG: hypothetical protein PHD10_01330 [Bacilli bacterium]|nr:hypothetical protein [Bacilli bacterium]MDD4607764.1 hypothetical protein [Bacilli bacterium]
MKKIGIFIMLGMVLLLTGCNKMKLVCNKIDEVGETYNFKQTIVFENNKIESVLQELEISSDDDLDKEYEELKQFAEEHKNEKAIKFEYSKDTNKIFVKIKLDPSLLSNKDPKELNMDISDLNITYDELKKKLESDGYSCE